MSSDQLGAEDPGDRFFDRVAGQGDASLHPEGLSSQPAQTEIDALIAEGIGLLLADFIIAAVMSSLSQSAARPA
jgi:hypothetical protein